MSQKVEKVHNFLDPPPFPRMFWTFLNLGKILNSMPPPLYLIWERFEIGKTLNLQNPPSNIEHKLKNP